ncbi:hypothetical protein [Aggregatibacter actinomycetemcomitans]|uniref:hypothetical protein n=1 Tax=Aggregatibacter actinomycetemcomitans TaxID=714 RepID=UPI001E49311E|nr:hypothetical protein [Aggregatibacter actinomycetemcomitans]
MKQIITTALLAIITGVMMLYAVALITLPAHADNTTDYCDNGMSEKISAEWESKAKAEWIETCAKLNIDYPTIGES